METLANILNRAANNNKVISLLLVSCFGLLAMRSMRQQQDIENLEVEKNSLLKANKAIKATIWNSKQQLYADAVSHSETAFIPLATLKAIYGEATPSESLSCKYTVSLCSMPALCLL